MARARLVDADASVPATDDPRWTVARRAWCPDAGRFGVAQLVAVETGALATVGAVYALPPIAATAAVVVVAAALLVVACRYGGRWGYEAGAAWLRLRRRRRRAEHQLARADQSAGEGWAEVRQLGGGLRVQSVIHRDTEVGIGLDEKGWFAAVELTGPDGLGESQGPQVRLHWLTPLAGPLSTLQVVVRDSPFSSADRSSLCARSYQELRQLLAVPTQRQAWIAVRLTPRDAADAVAGREGIADEVEGVHAMLGAAIARVGEALASHGIAFRVLDGAGLREALVASYGPGPYGGMPARAAARARESWRRWRAGRAVHLCFAVVAWPERSGPALLPALVAVPGALAVSVAVVTGAVRVTEHDAPVAVRVLVRVVAAAELAGQCQRQLRDSARRVGARLVRLDGEHASAVYATMPTASPDGWGDRC